MWRQRLGQERYRGGKSAAAAAASAQPVEMFQAQLESRIQKITGGFAGGLKRLASVGGGGGEKSAKERVREPPPRVEPSLLTKEVREQKETFTIGPWLHSR